MAADSNVVVLMQQQRQQQQKQQQFMAMDQAAAGGWNYFNDAGHRHYFSSSSSSINPVSGSGLQLAELERSLFSSEAADIDSLASASLISDGGDVFAGDDILGFLQQPPPEPPRTDDKPAVVVAGEAPLQSSSFQASVVRKQGGGGGGIPQPPRLRRSVADELKSLSLDQLVNNAAHKRASSSPLASPKKQAHKAEACSPPLPESKEGLHPPPVTPPPQPTAKRATSLLQRSLSSHALGQLPRAPSSAFDSAMQGLASVPSLSQLLLQSTNSSSSSSQVKPNSSSSSDVGLTSIRRVCSTGDIQRMNPESQDELGFKIGRYNLAERKERIHRYRQKRSERNFNKKIKYACRKTLADSRPRVRGRFARNEDVVVSTRPTMFPDDEVEALLEEEETGFLIDRQSSGELWDLN